MHSHSVQLQLPEKSEGAKIFFPVATNVKLRHFKNGLMKGELFAPHFHNFQYMTGWFHVSVPVVRQSIMEEG